MTVCPVAISVALAALGGEAGSWKNRDNAKVELSGGEVTITLDCSKNDFGWGRLDTKGLPTGVDGLSLSLKASAELVVGISLTLKENGAEKKFRAELPAGPSWEPLFIPFSKFRNGSAAVATADLEKPFGIMFSFGKKGGTPVLQIANLDWAKAPAPKQGPGAANAMALPPHPRLLFDSKGLEAFKQKVTREPWASQWKERLDALDKSLAEPLALPPRGGNWSHNYVCPVHAARLKAGNKTGDWTWEHICPVGPHTLAGDPSKATLDFDGNMMSGVHGTLATDLVRFALAFAVTGKISYLGRAKQIALGYSDQYKVYPLHNNAGKKGTGAHVFSQPLSEASWLIEMLQGADLIWEHLTEDERGRFEEGLVRPALNEVILKPKMGLHNIQCRLNSAIGLAGFLLGDSALVGRAIHDPDTGSRAQITKGVQEDGAWLEGAWGYHFFTIEGLWPLIEAARHCGQPMDLPEFKKMFDGPMALATPTFVLPAFNDSGEEKLPPGLYELAYAQFRDPAYAPILLESSRKSGLSLYFGVDQIPAGKPGANPGSATGSRNSPASGYAVLQKGSGTNATWLCLKYGPHGGGHGHPDKLSFVLYTKGRNVGVDPGTRAYGSPVHGGWDKTTFAHNTLTIDGSNQSEAKGTCLAFGSQGGVDFVTAEAGPIAPGVRYARTLALLDENLFVVIDRVQSEKSHTYDFVWHQRGAWEKTSGSPYTPPDSPGYRYVMDGVTLPLTADIALKARVDGAFATAFTASANEPTTLLVASGIGANTEDRVPLVSMRRTGTHTTIAWAIALDGVAAPLTCTSRGDETFVVVKHGGLSKTLTVSGDGKTFGVR